METTSIKGFGISGKDGIDSLKEFTVPVPQLKSNDLFVQIKGNALNPVDYKITEGAFNNASEEKPMVIGYDGSGVVVKVGDGVKDFKVGDEVYYSASSPALPGNYADFQVTDARVAAKKPSKLSHAEAAGVPLAFITAYEALVYRMKISANPEDNKGKIVLIVAGAGGVGSFAIQIAKQMLGLKVVATASREESIAFVKKMGADFIINHREPLQKGLEAHGISQVDHTFHTWDLDDDYLKQISAITKVYGSIGYITSKQGTAINPIFMKAQSLCAELMFTRLMHQFEIEKHGEILAKAQPLFDEGKLISNVSDVKPFSLENVKAGLKLLKSGKSMGKVAFTHE